MKHTKILRKDEHMTTVNKITPGFVVQTFDIATGKCLSQEFVASDQVDYEDEDGEAILFDSFSHGQATERQLDSLYSPFTMLPGILQVKP